jgi:hypothetical protein
MLKLRKECMLQYICIIHFWIVFTLFYVSFNTKTLWVYHPFAFFLHLCLSTSEDNVYVSRSPSSRRINVPWPSHDCSVECHEPQRISRCHRTPRDIRFTVFERAVTDWSRNGDETVMELKKQLSSLKWRKWSEFFNQDKDWGLCRI